MLSCAGTCITSHHHLVPPHITSQQDIFLDVEDSLIAKSLGNYATKNPNSIGNPVIPIPYALGISCVVDHHPELTTCVLIDSKEK